MTKKRIKLTNIRYGASFQRNGDKFLDLLAEELTGLTLVHALIRPKGLSEPRFAYCWIEVDGHVLDFTSGDEIHVAQSEWEALWEVERSFRYRGRAAARRIGDEGHWGPWDFEDPRAHLALPERPGRFNPRLLNQLVLRAQAATETAGRLNDAIDRGEPVAKHELAAAFKEDERCFTALLEVLGLDPQNLHLDVYDVFDLGRLVRDLASNLQLSDAEVEAYIKNWPDVDIEA